MATGRVQALSPEPTALGLTLMGTGLRIAVAYGLAWPQQCAVVVQKVAYGWGITDHGVAMMVTAGRLFARKMKIPPSFPGRYPWSLASGGPAFGAMLMDIRLLRFIIPKALLCLGKFFTLLCQFWVCPIFRHRIRGAVRILSGRSYQIRAIA